MLSECKWCLSGGDAKEWIRVFVREEGGKGKEMHVFFVFVRHHMALVYISHLNICPGNVICLF